jgi:hypothetical protein
MPLPFGLKKPIALNHGMNVVPKDKRCAPYARNTIMGKLLPRRNSPMPARMRSMPPNQMVGPVVATARPPEPCHPTNKDISQLQRNSSLRLKTY